VDAKLFAGPGGELIQVKATEPLAPKTNGILLAVVAVVKDKVHRVGLLVQKALEQFDPVAIYQQHTVYINSISCYSQLRHRFALALYLPGLKAEVSREIR
jgi:hypothetical protein